LGYYPIFLDLSGREVLVVGGGKVAERKVTNLLEAGAVITVVSPRLTPALKALVKNGKVAHQGKRFSSDDLSGSPLIFAASCCADVNSKVAKAAKGQGLLVNVADAPELCSFILPAVVSRGPLKIAISTSGESPFAAAHLREKLEDEFGQEYGILVSLIGAVRTKLLKNKGKNVKNDKIFKALLTPEVLCWIGDGSEKELNAHLKALLGKGFTLKALGVNLKGRA
jgi:precorrin-2 dehydrogenase/sirohydrochlorin ferrochelatase